MASKNNPARRAERNNQQKEHQGKPVKPVLYVGSFVGHGRFVAAQFEDGKLVMDAAGKPIPYRQL